MSDLQVITAWEAVFDCQFDIVVDALRDLLTRLQFGEIRPLTFGFIEAGEGIRRTSIEYEEEQHEQGRIFGVKRVDYNRKTGKRVEETVGVFLIYEGKDIRTRVALLCPLGRGHLSIDDTVEIAKHFASEARGHGVNVEVRPLSTDHTRDFAVSTSISDVVTLIGIFNHERRAFGYWIEVPEQIPADTSRIAFIVLKTDGSSPRDMASRSPWWRHEVGAIECVQIKDKTQLKVYAPSFEERSHFWAYINIFREKLQKLGLLEDFRVGELDQDPLREAQTEMRDFKSLVERQIYKDILVDDRPQENIARALLQTFLIRRSYREVPVRGGQSDLLVFLKQGRFLYETKIWRGPQYYQQGLKEIEEYIIGEDSDQELLGIFYVVFDATKSKRAKAYLGQEFSTDTVCDRDVGVVIIDLSPPKPSRKL